MKILITAFFCGMAGMCAAPAPGGSGSATDQLRVPPIAPDTIPGWVLDPASLSTDPDRLSGTFVRNLVVVLFHRHATAQQRRQAIEAVEGRVIGGRRTNGGDGFYYVWIPGDSSAAPLLGATSVLRSFPQVHTAVLELTSNIDVP